MYISKEQTFLQLYTDEKIENKIENWELVKEHIQPVEIPRGRWRVSIRLYRDRVQTL